MSDIQGVFPGGPRRQDGTPPQDGGTGAGLRFGEDVEADATTRAIGSRTKRKRRSILLLLGVAVLIAGATGVYFGVQSRTTLEQLAEQEWAGASDLNGIVDEVMDELWRMEDVEAARNSAR